MNEKLAEIRSLIEDEVSEPTYRAVCILLGQVNEDIDGATEVAMENLGNRIEVRRLRKELEAR